MFFGKLCGLLLLSAAVWFDPAVYTVSEGDAAVTFIVGRTGNVNITANFTFMTQPDTADGKKKLFHNETAHNECLFDPVSLSSHNSK